MIFHEKNNLFLHALENKNYSTVNDFLKKGIPNLTYNNSNSLACEQFSIYFNQLKSYLIDLYLDGEFYGAKKIIELLCLYNKKNNKDTTFNYADLHKICDSLIIQKSANIDFLWNEYFKNEKFTSTLIRFTMTAIEHDNTQFLSSYDNIKSTFNDSLLLKNVINMSFSKNITTTFFKKLEEIYFLYNPSFNFKKNLQITLKHQLLIRNTSTTKSEQFKHIEYLYSIYFPQSYCFKLAQGLYQSLKKKPENEITLKTYIHAIFATHSFDDIKAHGKFLLAIDPELKENFKLFNKLSHNLKIKNTTTIKLNKI